MIISKRDILLESNVETVWQLLTDLEHQQWRSSLRFIEKQDDKHFIGYDHKDNKIEYIILNKIPHELYEYNMMGHDMEGHWIGKLKDVDGKTQLTLTQAIELKKNKLFIRSTIEKQMDQFVLDLQKALSEHSIESIND